MHDDLLPIPDLPHPTAVLVVDDTRAVRHLAARLLAEDGCRVFEAAGAVEALEVLGLARGGIDVVLVDVLMPDVTGVDLARLIREQWPDTAVVFMSAHPAQVLAREGQRDLAVPFLAKPFTREELRSAVRRALDRRARPDRSAGQGANGGNGGNGGESHDEGDGRSGDAET